MLRILIVSHYIAPTQAIASIRWTKISKYIKKNHDAEITVLTTKKNYISDDCYEKYIKDKLLEKDLIYFDHYVEFQSGARRNKIYRIQKMMRKEKSESADASTIYQSGTESFAMPGIRHSLGNIVKKIETDEIVKDGYKEYSKLNKQFDVIVSSYGPIWTHLLAKKIAKQNPKAFWLADFRDLYAGNPYETKRDFNRHKRFVGEKLRNASAITKVAPGMIMFERPEQKVFVLPNGFDWEERRKPEKPGTFSMVFTGTFYRNETSLAPILSAVQELISEGELAKEDVEIIFAGRGGEYYNKEVHDAGIEDLSNNFGTVSREESLRFQQNAAILLQSCLYTKTYKPLWTGKMFEYIMAEKPIVVSIIGDTPSDQYVLMPKLGGVAVEECRKKETYEPMKKYILSKYKEWKETGNVTIERDEDYCRSFSYEKIAESFWSIIHNAV